ncbi:MAG: RHS repeat-associated core domain-containing protein [Bacteriovoracaceae bacterium]|jgi:RHS repeat-associated protein|nr:RHS repeat-associated core domain-containing protein [Bacteriovoracaceae bacterium]
MTGNFKNLTYSSENQLVKIQEYKNSLLTKEILYYYDALGRRMRKVVSDKENSSDSFERRYVYDGQEILAEYDSNSVIGVYTHSTLRTDDVLAVDVKSSKLASSTGSYFYLKDALGSVVDIVDGSGNIVQHYAYSSFGKILKITDGSGSDITANPLVKTSYGFTNREHDVESGMMYYRARYYQPEIGRFISKELRTTREFKQ